MIADRFSPGDAVRVRLDDPRVHTRAPRYVRGRRGTIREVHGHHQLPDAVVSRRRPEPTAVYAVAFRARELWGEGDHEVVVNLWDAYLEADQAALRQRTSTP